MYFLIDHGGPVMWLLLATAMLSLMVFFERLFHLHRAQIKPESFIQGIINNIKRGNQVEAISICEDTPGPVSRIIEAAVLHADEGEEAIKQAIHQAGLLEVPRLENRMMILATISKTAPLLGVLGTITGMIQQLTAMEVDAPLVHMGNLTGGLWEALLTSAVGLSIAIPTYAGYNFLYSRVNAILIDMRHAAALILAHLTTQNGTADKAI